MYCHSYFCSLNVKLLQSGRSSHSPTSEEYFANFSWNNVLIGSCVMTSGMLVPDVFGTSVHVASKLSKTRLLIYIFCIFIKTLFSCITKNLGAETNQPSSVDFKGPDMIDTSWEFGLLCLAAVTLNHIKAGNMMWQMGRSVLKLLRSSTNFKSMKLYKQKSWDKAKAAQDPWNKPENYF